MADRPMRIQRRRTKGWKMPEGAVYVGRPGLWGNPFTAAAAEEAGYRDGPYMAARAYRLWLADHIDYRQPAPDVTRHFVLANLHAVRGVNLACWCRLCPRHAAGKPFGEECEDCAPCHADVLGRLANGLSCNSPPASGERNG